MSSERIEALVAEMTLAEKVGQMTQAEKGSITPDEVREYAIGSVLSGGGGNPSPNDPSNWAAMVDGFVAASLGTRHGIPLLYGSDAVHGHSNVRGAVIFPHNIGLGATGDPALVERVAAATAQELLATGVRWDFAPTVAVPHDIRWGRTFEGFSDDPGLVADMGAAIVRGFRGGDPDRIDVLACPKHYLGDGGTSPRTAHRYPWVGWWDAWPDNWHMDQGDTAVDEATLRERHLPPYPPAIAAGALSIMASYNSWNGDKLHGSRYLMTDVLKGELGFSGFIVSDWMGVDQLDPDYSIAVVRAIDAGVDMVMVPIDFRRFIATTTAAVEAGAISMERIDDAVRRILQVKGALGFFDAPRGRPGLEVIGSADHRAVAREAAARSAVLLRNEGDALPIDPTLPAVLVAGPAADDVGLQCGGWTIEWQGGAGDITAGTTLLAALREALPGTEIGFDPGAGFPDGVRASLGIVVVGEEPYAEGYGDRDDLTLSPADAASVARMRQRCDRLVLVVYSGRPLIITEQAAMADAIVAAWLPGSEATGLADVLVGRVAFSGRLPIAWPRSMAGVPSLGATEPPLFPFGYGLSTAANGGSR